MGHLERRALPAPVVGRGESTADRVKDAYCKNSNFCAVGRNSRFTGVFGLVGSPQGTAPSKATRPRMLLLPHYLWGRSIGLALPVFRVSVPSA
jgi:hypothetical protein